MRFARGVTTLGAGVLVAAIAACGGSDAATADPAAPVVKDFGAYSTAVTKKDGETAADLMTATSVAYYDGLRKLALGADQKTLAGKSMIDQLTTLSMRADLPAADLRSLNAHDLVKKAVEISLISNGATPEDGLRQVKVTGNTATAELVMTEGAQYPVGFTREGGQWKFDVTSLLAPAESGLNQARKTQKMTEHQLIDQVMIARYGKTKAETLSRPVG